MDSSSVLIEIYIPQQTANTRIIMILEVAIMESSHYYKQRIFHLTEAEVYVIKCKILLQ